MQPRGANPGRGHDPGAADQAGENVVQGVDQQPAAGGHEERRRPVGAHGRSRSCGVVVQRGDGGGMQQHLPGLAELGVEDRQHPGVRSTSSRSRRTASPIRMPVTAAARSTPGRSPPAAAGGTSAGGRPGQRVDVASGSTGAAGSGSGSTAASRLAAPRSPGPGPAGGERTSAPPISRRRHQFGLARDGLPGPGHRRVGGDRCRADALQMADELHQQLLGLDQLEAQRPSQAQVLRGPLPQARS